MIVYDHFMMTTAQSDDERTPSETEPRFIGPLAAQLTELNAGRPVRQVLASRLAAADSSLPLPSEPSAWVSADRVALDALVGAADAERDDPWPQPLASLAARVHEDGDRDRWEQRAFARQRRLSRAVGAALATADDGRLADVLDGVLQLCEQSSWCWPAHDDVRRARGEVLGDVDRPFLDLGAGEAVGQLAVLDHVLGDRLEARYPGVRRRIRREARRRVIDPFVQRRDWHWIGLDGDVHNWNPWIHGNVLLAALRLLDDPDDAALRAQVVDLAVEGLDRYLVALPDDGAIDEGYAYWWNGACRALEAVDLLDHALGGALRPGDVDALRETVAFPHRTHLGGRWFLNLADGQARPPAAQPWHALHRAARAVGDELAEAFAAAHRGVGAPAASEHEGLPRLLRGLADAAWVTATPASAPLPAEVRLDSTQTLLARQHEGSDEGLALAVKGGHNGEHHNHNDVGSFVVASDGVPAIVDAGRPTYTLQTFGPERYSIWTMRSGWHNAPVLAGAEQSAGAAFAARDVRPVTIDDGCGLSLDLVGAYPDSGFLDWRRSAVLDRSAARVVIEDSWTTEGGAGAAAGTSVRMVIAGAITLGDGTARIDPLDGATPLVLRWEPPVPADVVVRELDDPMLGDVWGERLHRLDLDVAGESSIRVIVEQRSGAEEDAR